MSGIQAVWKENHQHAKTTARSPFTPKDAWCHHQLVRLPSITCSFPSTTMPDNVLHDLEVKTNQVLLPKLGCNRNAPRQAVCGNSNFAGIELQKLALEKGIGQLRHFFMSLQTEGFPENLAEIAVSWAQLLA